MNEVVEIGGLAGVLDLPDRAAVLVILEIFWGTRGTRTTLIGLQYESI